MTGHRTNPTRGSTHPPLTSYLAELSAALGYAHGFSLSENSFQKRLTARRPRRACAGAVAVPAAWPR
jgi:hypothetical protein